MVSLDHYLMCFFPHDGCQGDMMCCATKQPLRMIILPNWYSLCFLSSVVVPNIRKCVVKGKAGTNSGRSHRTMDELLVIW